MDDFLEVLEVTTVSSSVIFKGSKVGEGSLGGTTLVSVTDSGVGMPTLVSEELAGPKLQT